MQDSARATTEEPESGPRELNRLEVLRGLRIATWEAGFSTVWASLTTGIFLTGFALWLGADNVAMGLLTAIPTFAGLIQIVSSYFGERLRSRKAFTAWFSLGGRALWLLILALPIFLSHPAALTGFLFLFALSYASLNVPAPAYMSWMSDLVPADHRGRYFGRRNMIAGIVGMIIALPAAWFLDVATKRHHWETLGFGVLFGVGVAGGLASFLCLLRQPEPPKHPASTEGATGLRGVLDYYRAPFADRNFMRLMRFNIILGLGQNFAAPFFTIYALQVLQLDYVKLQVFATLTSITSLASMPLWGYLADKFGNKPLLAISAFGTFTLPLHWMLTSPAKPTLTLLLVMSVNLLGGASWAGVGLTQFNLLIRTSPPQKTAIYVATMAAVTGLTGGLAPLAGGALMRALEGWSGQVLGLALKNFQVAFFIAALFRLVALFFLRTLEDADSATARDVIQQLSRANPRTWRHIRELQRGGAEETRLRATEVLAETRTRLAVAELEKALNDPSPAVRSEAARALGEIGDSGSMEPLIAALSDPATGLIDEAAIALGRIGDRRATPALIAVLQVDPAHVARADRLAVIKSLGKLGGGDAAQALLAALETASEEETAEAVVYALGEIGDPHATLPLVACLESTDSRPLRLALIRSLGELGDPAACAPLQATLASLPADPVLLPALADALARLSADEAIPLLLDRLTALDSPVARKQVANAIGTLMGESDSVYGLLAQEEFARDGAVSKLLQEMQRRVRGTTSAAALDMALQAYVSGHYRDCLQALQPLREALPALTEADTLSLSTRTLLDHVLDSSADDPPVEIVLLAFIALRACLASES